MSVMAALVPAIHVLLHGQGVDARHSPGMTPSFSHRALT
jgi:hypothetical protein